MTPYVLLTFKPDVIHSHGLIAGFIAVFWGKLFGKRVITTTHSIYHFPRNGIYKNFAKYIFENSDKVLTLSQLSAREIERLGINRDKIMVFTYWIDLNKFKKGKGAKLPHPAADMRSHMVGRREFVVLFVGRLVSEKGVLVLLEAARQWDKNITLVIIGTGPLESVIRNKISVTSNIKFLGKIGNEKLPDYYSAADLTIVPSIHEEGFGRVILESLACGTPVVASNRGAIPEAMDESVGKLIEITPQNIKREVEYFFNNPDKLDKLAKNCRSFARNKYSYKNLNLITASYKD
jgi:glycosyltransferase involved in cell wall biosynthesis